MTLGQGQENDLDLQYAHIFIISIGFQVLFLRFPIDKPMLPNFDLAIK